MTLWQRLKRPPWRTFLLLGSVLGLLVSGYLIWSPGTMILDGRHDRGSNGIWLQHGWLGDDAWFRRYDKDKSLFRNEERIIELTRQLKSHGITHVFPHACPTKSTGTISAVHPQQTKAFLDQFGDFEVIPWIGGVLDENCFPDDPKWRKNFTESSLRLLESHPRLAGLQINIEPLPSGNPHFLTLLDELRRILPRGKTLSIAAYPPPTRWHPYPDVHWDEAYFREVARRSDLIVPMMYDTAIRLPKVYARLMSDWTTEVLDWAEGTPVLLGIPAYDDADPGYHSPGTENIGTALSGIHSALSGLESLPENFRGISIYSEWEMEPEEWSQLTREYLKPWN